jgi:hypothetical protein
MSSIISFDPISVPSVSRDAWFKGKGDTNVFEKILIFFTTLSGISQPPRSFSVHFASISKIHLLVKID